MHKTVRETMSRTERGDKFKTIPANTEFVIGATIRYWPDYGGNFVVIASGEFSTRFVKVADIVEVPVTEPEPTPVPETLVLDAHEVVVGGVTYLHPAVTLVKKAG